MKNYEKTQQAKNNSFFAEKTDPLACLVKQIYHRVINQYYPTDEIQNTFHTVDFQKFFLYFSQEIHQTFRSACYAPNMQPVWQALWNDEKFYKKMSLPYDDSYPEQPLLSSSQHPLDLIMGYFLYNHGCAYINDHAAVDDKDMGLRWLRGSFKVHRSILSLACLLHLCVEDLLQCEPRPQSCIEFVRDYLGAAAFDSSIESVKDLFDYLGLGHDIVLAYPSHAFALAGWLCMELGKFIEIVPIKILYFLWADACLRLAQEIYTNAAFSPMIGAAKQVFQLNLYPFFARSEAELFNQWSTELSIFIQKYQLTSSLFSIERTLAECEEIFSTNTPLDGVTSCSSTYFGAT